MTKSSKIKIKRKNRGKEYRDDILEAICETLEEILEELRKK